MDVLPERTTFSLSIPETSNEAGSMLISLFRPDLATNISMSKYSASLSHSEEDNRLEDFQCNLLRGIYSLFGRHLLCGISSLESPGQKFQ